MRLVFDLDGVLRDLYSYISKKYKILYPTVWDFDIKGKNIFETIRSDLDILIKAKPTKYLKIIKKLYKIKDIEIWTAQPPDWQYFTSIWIDHYIGKDCKVLFLTGEQKRVELNKRKDTYLLEDSPNFKSYSNILLIDRPYNHHIKHCFRIKSPKHLKDIIKFELNFNRD